MKNCCLNEFAGRSGASRTGPEACQKNKNRT